MDNKLDQLAFDFFKVFAQYESSLKEHGYFQEARNGRINVDWDRFVNEKIGSEFLDKLEEHKKSADYILNNPPKKQVVNSGVIVWDEVNSDEKSVQALFGHISRIRNNLYHGAKFNGTWFSPERSFTLLKHGLIILKHFQNILNNH